MIRDERGFNLVELMIVVALLGVVSAISIPNILSQLPKWHVNGVTRGVAANLMMARLKAVQNNKEYGILFTLGGVDSYKLQKNDSGWKDEGVITEATRDVTMEFGGSSTCTNNRIEFNANGTASCSPIWIKTKDNAFVRKIIVDTTTGRIHVLFCEKEDCSG